MPLVGVKCVGDPKSAYRKMATAKRTAMEEHIYNSNLIFCIKGTDSSCQL